VPDKFKRNAKVEAGYGILDTGYRILVVKEMIILIRGDFFRN